MYSELISHPTARNCIVWGNTNGEIEVDVTSISHVHYCNVLGGFIGPGNIDADPLCVDPATGDLRLQAGSPCIDAADAAVVPEDTLDLDRDGDTTEPTPYDADGLPRFVDDRATADTGVGLVDIGAYEFQPSPCDGDVDGSGDVGFSDLLLIIVSWGPCRGCPADLDGDGDVGNIDLITVLAHWGDCPR
ncbi:MAG: hypothetical protein HKO59_09705 [Phycisphaerales bacterium]|nr:hypothetical protein [Phycisphaerales bacterium]